MLIPAFFLILLVGWILDHIFIEEAEGKIKTRDAVNMAVARKEQQAAVAELPRRSLAPAVAVAAPAIVKPQAAKPVAPTQRTVTPPSKPMAPAVPPPATAIP